MELMESIFGGANMIKSNVAKDNTECNICIENQSNSIEKNLVTGSEQGILFVQDSNFYANNRAFDNINDFYNAAGQTNGGGNASF